MRLHSALFALLVVFMGLAFVPHASADWPSKWEWETQTQYSHVRSITWSGDSQYIAATSFDDENGVQYSVAEMWDASLKDHRTFGTDDAQPISAALNQDGSRLFTGLSTGEVAVWDTVSGTILQRMPVHKTAPELEISDDRKWLVSWEEDSVIIWNAETLEQHWMIKNPSQTRESVHFVFASINRESEILAVGNSAGVILVYDLESKRHTSSLVTGEDGKPYGVFFRHKGELALGYDPSLITLCDTQSGQCYKDKLAQDMYYVALGHESANLLIVATNDGNLNGDLTNVDYDMIFLQFITDLYNVSDVLLSPHEVFIAVGAYPGRLIILHSPMCLCSFRNTSPVTVI